MHKLKDNVRTIRELSEFIPMDEKTVEKLEDVANRFPILIPRYYLSLINPDDINDPIRRMCVPSLEENEPGGSWDTSGEGKNTVIEGLQHKYPQTVLILSTNRCAMYCRHCFRKRMVGLSDEETVKNFRRMLSYIRAHEEINNVLVSGGDAFLNSNRLIDFYLGRLSNIRHLHYIRLGTRVPATFPALVNDNPALLEILKTYSSKKTIYVSTQFNHPKELTPEAKKCIKNLLDAGVVVNNQAVLLKRVNDDPETLAALMGALTEAGVIPYYVFQCRPVSHVMTSFQVPLMRGCDIVERAKTMCNGYAKRFRYVMSHERGKIEALGVINEKEMLFKFHQAKDPRDCGRLFSVRFKKDRTWLEQDLL